MTPNRPRRAVMKSGQAAGEARPGYRRAGAGPARLMSLTVIAAAACTVLAIPAMASAATTAKSSTRTIVSAKPSSAKVDGSVTLSATVKSSRKRPTGKVRFSSDGSRLCTATLFKGRGHCTARFAAAGTFSVKGSYSGDHAHKTSSGTTTVKVSRYTPSVTVSTSTVTPYPGEAVTLSATVAGGPTATGSVQFSDASGDLCKATLSGGSANCKYTWTAAGGPFTITGAYSGDAAHNPAGGTAAGAVTVTLLATTTTIVSIAPGSVDAGSPATVTVTVTSPAGTPTPTGTVAVAPTNPALTGTYECKATLVDGSGSCMVTPPIPAYGVIDYEGTYSGDPEHATSVSTGTHELIVPDTTTTTVTFVPATVAAGSPDTLTATVVDQGMGNISPSGGGTGTVEFVVTPPGGSPTTICAAATLTYDGGGDNVATCDYTPAVSGSYAVTATYSGDMFNRPSSGSGMLTVT